MRIFSGGRVGRGCSSTQASPGAQHKSCSAAEARFGAGVKPEAIILTHGHFDHAGSAQTLAEQWEVPIYAHRLEVPYVTGRAKYPPKDPTVGGAIAFLSRFMPARAESVGDRLRELPPNESARHTRLEVVSYAGPFARTYFLFSVNPIGC